MTSIVVFVADGHSNSKTGLYNPKLLIGGRRPHDPSTFQLKLWNECWIPFWKFVAEVKVSEKGEVIVVFVGDWIDIIPDKQAGLIAVKKSDALTIAASNLEPALEVADVAIMMKGTPRHTGEQAEMEELLAEDITIAEPDPDTGTAAWFYMKAEIDGVSFDVSHHPATSSRRPWTRAQAVAREGAIVRARYLERGKKPPDVAVRAHVHWSAEGGRDPKPQTLFCHPWQLTTDYGYRIGYGTFFEPPGGFVVVCNNGEYVVKPKKYEMKERGVWIRKSKKSLLQRVTSLRQSG
jgi:hypothetical protein